MPSLIVTPGFATIEVGEQRGFVANDETGRPVSDVQWSIEPPIAKLVNENGKLRIAGAQTGRAVITATAGGRTATAVISIVPAGAFLAIQSGTPQGSTAPAPSAEPAAPALATQTSPERIWIAGRYDGNRVIIYFAAVHFGETAPANASELADPVAGGFFIPEELPASYIAGFQKDPSVEQFHLGDLYDVQIETGFFVTVKLTTLVGAEGDEEVGGNFSYIGALGTVIGSRDSFLDHDYFIVRPHVARPVDKSKIPLPAVQAGLQDDPVPFAVQAQIESILENYRQAHPDKGGGPYDCPAEANLPLAFKVQAFRLANGALRYYVKAGWKAPGGEYGECLTGELKRGNPNYVRGVWLAPEPTLHILAVEERTSPYDGLDNILPDVRSVVDLDGGRTGLIVVFSGEDDTSLALLIYEEGSIAVKMPVLQSISAGE